MAGALNNYINAQLQRKREEEERIRAELERERQQDQWIREDAQAAQAAGATRSAIDTGRNSIVSSGGSVPSPLLWVDDDIPEDSPFYRSVVGGPKTPPQLPARVIEDRPIAAFPEPPVDPVQTASVPERPSPIISYPEEEVSEKQGGLLSGLFEKMGATTPESQSALGSALIRAGGAMMSAGADGLNLWGAVGKGLTAGADGFDAATKAQNEQLVNSAAIRQANLKAAAQIQQDAYRQKIGNVIQGGAGAGGLSTEQLYELAQLQYRAGDTAEAKQTLEQIQKLHQTAAGDGMVIENGRIVPAAGFLQSTQAVESAKSSGRKAGELPFESTNDLRELDRVNAERAAAGLQPVSAESWIRENNQRKSPKPSADEVFLSKSAEKQAATFDELTVAGRQAGTRLGKLNEIEKALSRSSGGAVAGLQNWASQWGIKLGDNASELEYANALINQMVPEQRPAGSGAMSDADLELFKQSVPRLMNSPDGNRLVIATMRAIAEYDQKIGEIAASAQQGRISRSAATEQMQSLPNPIDNVRRFAGGNNQSAGPQSIMLQDGRILRRR